MIDLIAEILPGIIILATYVGYQIHEERVCNRAFKRECDKWKEVCDE